MVSDYGHLGAWWSQASTLRQHADFRSGSTRAFDYWLGSQSHRMFLKISVKLAAMVIKMLVFCLWCGGWGAAFLSQTRTMIYKQKVLLVAVRLLDISKFMAEI